MSRPENPVRQAHGGTPAQRHRLRLLLLCSYQIISDFRSLLAGSGNLAVNLLHRTLKHIARTRVQRTHPLRRQSLPAHRKSNAQGRSTVLSDWPLSPPDQCGVCRPRSDTQDTTAPGNPPQKWPRQVLRVFGCISGLWKAPPTFNRGTLRSCFKKFFAGFVYSLDSA